MHFLRRPSRRCARFDGLERRQDESLHLEKQPEGPQELDQAIAVLEAQELGCHKYAGDEPAILKRISAAYCDHSLPRQRRPGPLIQWRADPFQTSRQRRRLLGKSLEAARWCEEQVNAKRRSV